MAVEIVTAPAIEPVTLQEAKDFLRVDASTDDALIEGLILAARERAESYTRRALITQTLDLFLPAFPDCIEVPRPPLQSVTTVKYIDDNGAQQTLSSSLYQVDTKSGPGRIAPAWNETWPSTRVVFNAVEVRYVAGYGAGIADVPRPIQQAMLLLIGEGYAHREETVVGTVTARLPQTAEALLWPYRDLRF